MSIVLLNQIAPERVDTLLDAAFGTDRHGRTAYKIREGMLVIDALSFAWVEHETLLGTLQCWPVDLTGDDGKKQPMIMVGPVAVHPDRQQQGIGLTLMDQAMAVHDALPAEQHRPMMLIGDQSYYGRWGFYSTQTAGWRVPGPVERDRLLLRWGDDDALPATGALGPAH